MAELKTVKTMLQVQDMSRAIDFYKTLGFSPGYLSPHWSELVFRDTALGLHDGGDGSKNATGLSLQFEDLTEAYKTALSHGASSISKPKRQQGEPIKLATIEDTEGNQIMLTEFTG